MKDFTAQTSCVNTKYAHCSNYAHALLMGVFVTHDRSDRQDLSLIRRTFSSIKSVKNHSPIALVTPFVHVGKQFTYA